VVAWLRVGALPNTGQIFHGDSAPCCPGRLYDAFADDMVGVTLEPLLPPRYPFLDGARPPARAASALRGFPLKTAACGCVPVPNSRDLRATERRAIACDSYIASAQVHAKDALGVHGGLVGVVGADHQAPAALAVADQVCFRKLHGVFEHLPLVAADAQPYLNASIKRRDVGAVVLNAVQARRIETHGGVLSERVDALPVSLVRRSHHGDSPNGVLRHQPEPRPHVIVNEALQPDFVELLSLPRHAADVGARRVEPLLQAQESGFFAGGRPQGQGDGSYAHTSSIPVLRLKCSQQTGAKAAKAGRVLPGLQPPVVGFHA